VGMAVTLFPSSGYCTLRGMQIKPDNLGSFRLKLRIVRGHVALEPAWPQCMLAPHSRDHHVTDPQACCEFARAPLDQ
jgi:hypothetical protein